MEDTEPSSKAPDLQYWIEEHSTQTREQLQQTNARLVAIEKALFDPENGIVYMRSWICRTVTWVGIVGSVLAGIALFIFQVLHFLGDLNH